jgi:hypothetical protein
MAYLITDDDGTPTEANRISKLLTKAVEEDPKLSGIMQKFVDAHTANLRAQIASMGARIDQVIAAVNDPNAHRRIR